MRTLIMLAAAGGSIVCTASGSISSRAILATTPQAEPMMQKADWYCGPECQRHRYWEHRRAERHREWQESHQYPYRSYNNTFTSSWLLIKHGRGDQPRPSPSLM